VVGSLCVLGDDGRRHRIVVFGGESPSVVHLGDGVTAAGDLNAVAM